MSGGRLHTVTQFGNDNSNYGKGRKYIPWAQYHAHLTPTNDSGVLLWFLL